MDSKEFFWFLIFVAFVFVVGITAACVEDSHRHERQMKQLELAMLQYQSKGVPDEANP
jgi:hypothetical protein